MEDLVEVKVGLGTCVSALEGASVEVACFVVLEVGDSPPDMVVEVVEMISMVKDPVRIRGPMVVISEVHLHILKISLLLLQWHAGLMVFWQQYAFGPARDSIAHLLSATAEHWRNQTTFIERSQ